MNHSDLNYYISGDLEVTVEFLTEIDKLVQLLESPIFICEYYLQCEDCINIFLHSSN